MYNYTDNVEFLLDICRHTAAPVSCAIWIIKEHESIAFRLLEGLLLKDTTNLLHYTRNSIRFKNGSQIDILCCYENYRGRKYTFSLYEKDISEKFLSNIIYPTTSFGFAPKMFWFEEEEL